MIKIIIFFTLVASLTVKSQECQTCDDTKNITNYLKDISNYINRKACSPALIPFELKTSFTFDQRCQLIGDLEILREISLTKYGPMFQKSFAPHIESEKAGIFLYHWLIARIKNIYYYPSDVSTAINLGLCEDTNVCNQSYKRGDIGLADSYFEKPFPIDRIKVLIHEARHTDGHDYLKNPQIDDDNIYYDTLHIDCNETVITTENANHANHGKTCDENLDGAIGTSLFFRPVSFF